MNKILLIITVTLLFIVPYNNAKCYDMPYSDEFYRKNSDIYEQHLKQDKNNIIYNNAKQEVDSQTSFDILNNNTLPLPASIYNHNNKAYQNDKKVSNFTKTQEAYDMYMGLSKAAADGSLYQITQDYKDEIIRQEQAITQKNFDDKWFVTRVALGIQRELANRDLSRLYYERAELNKKGKDLTEINYKIEKQKDYVASIPTGSSGTIASGVASAAASMWDKYELLFWLISSFFIVYFIIKIVTKIKLLIKNDEQTYLNETCKKLSAIYKKYANLATTENINDAKKHLLFCKRTKEVDELNLSKQIDDWTGIIKDIKVAQADLEETGNVIIEFAPNVEIQIPFSFKNDEGIAEIIGELQIGDLIKFSGILEKCEDKEVPVIYSRAKISPFRTEMIVKAGSISLLQKKKKTWLK